MEMESGFQEWLQNGAENSNESVQRKQAKLFVPFGAITTQLSG